MGTDTGVVKYEDGTLTPALDDIEVLKLGVRAIHQDLSGTLWIGTNGGGIVRSSVDDTRVVDSNDGLPNDLVFDVYQDGDGVVWAGTAGGAARYEGGRFSAAARQRRARPPRRPCDHANARRHALVRDERCGIVPT